jgi:hypothetical protein
MVQLVAWLHGYSGMGRWFSGRVEPEKNTRNHIVTHLFCRRVDRAGLNGEDWTVTPSSTGKSSIMQWFLVLCLLLVAVPATAEEPGIDTLFAWMTGSFSSAAQAAEDSAFYHITLEMAPIWSEREGEYWIYVEQAVGSMPEKPYRQRVYGVTVGDDGVYESAVYTLADPEQYIGAWKDEAPLADITPEDLLPREGCTVFLEYVGEEVFKGGTRDKGCLSTLRGATYATSEVVITPDRIESWDRGFDETGAQVWGAELGPYIFIGM